MVTYKCSGSKVYSEFQAGPPFLYALNGQQTQGHSRREDRKTAVANESVGKDKMDGPLNFKKNESDLTDELSVTTIQTSMDEQHVNRGSWKGIRV